VPYFHVVFTVPAEIEVIAFQNQTVVYDILFRAASETLRTIAADPKHLGAEIGFLAVLHTWGQALTQNPQMNVSDTAEAHKLLEELPLGQAKMMTFEGGASGHLGQPREVGGAAFP
jgi:hypothetical protein